MVASVAQIIRSVIGKPYIGYNFAYQYQISTMREKATDTDICMYLKIHALSDVYKYRVAFFLITVFLILVKNVLLL